MFGFGRFACFVGSRGADCGTSDQAQLVVKPSSLSGCGMAVSLMSVLSRNAWLVLFLALSSGSASASEEDYYRHDMPYASEGNWRISVNVARKSCFMASGSKSEAGFQVGGDQRSGTMSYFFLFDTPPGTYRNYENVVVTIKYDQRSRWVGNGFSLTFGDHSGVGIQGVDVKVVNEIADAKYLNLMVNDRDLGNFSLAGSRKALAKMRQCIAAMNIIDISLQAIAGGGEADIPSPSAPAPTPKEDEGKRGDALPGGAEDGSSFGNGKESILASTALGEDYYASDKIYAKEGNWWVWVTRARKSCSMAATFAGDAEITVGGDRNGDKLAYFFLFSEASWEYEQGKDYEVTVEYDGHSTWAGDGVGVAFPEQNGVALEGVQAEAVDEFAAAKTLGLKIGSREHGVFDLSGSREGIAKLRECDAAVDGGRISLAEIDGGEKADTPSPSVPAPTPKEDETRPDNAPFGRDDGGPVPGKGKEPVVVSGSGFFVDEAGHLLTNAHVVEGCGNARLRFDGRTEPALIVARERDHDLALLKMRGRSPAFATFRGGPPIRLGESVVVFGYPLSGYLSKSGNLSTGLVASLAGVEDNEAEMQISAPVQSGNSGGPVVDQSGHVVGVVVAKSNTSPLDDDRFEVIQNANFAIKADVAKAFLDHMGVAYETEPPGEELKTPDVADIARAFSAQVICEVQD